MMSAYTIFRMMINTADVSQYGVDDKTQEILYVMHVAFVLTVSILTINLLIALMANKAGQVAYYR